MANDDTATDDPFEAELVAYLDGELDAATARKVEARLAKDPAARMKATALKKSFDMLDYLPKPEPSPNFTARTLDKLPAIKPGAPEPPAAAPLSSSVPVAVFDDHAPRAQSALRAASVAAAIALFALLGYFATAAARPFLFPPREPEEAKAEAPVTPDARVIENLPLYAVADDLALITELAKSEYFGDEPAVAYDLSLKTPPGDAHDTPTPKQMETLTKAFRELPQSRQAEIVKLDADLHAKEPKERDRLLRTLEAYAVWLQRLPDAERRGVMTAATPVLRLRVIHDMREQQWMGTLPPPLRKKVDSLTNAKEKAELIQQWKDEEAIRRDRWAFIRQHADAFAANKSPWPFDTEAGRADVIDYARTVFKVDDAKRCRLSSEELAEYRRTFLLAQRDGAWAWYGLTVYELNKLHPYLPEPSDPKQLLTDVADLPDPLARQAKKMSVELRSVMGKWPEFPLEVHRKAQNAAKSAAFPALGPARLADFKEPVRTFATTELFPKLTGDEKAVLQRLEGKWPEFPRELVKYAHKYDLAVPGVTLPGSPKKWDATYGTRPRN